MPEIDLALDNLRAAVQRINSVNEQKLKRNKQACIKELNSAKELIGFAIEFIER